MSEKIIFFKDQQAFVQEMSYEEAGRLFKAAFDYSLGASEKEVIKKHFPEKERFLIAAWKQTQSKLDYAAERAKQKSASSTRAARARWDKTKQHDADASERIHLDANASECNATECTAMPTITNTITNTNTKRFNSHTLVNGKLYRTAEDGQRYYMDDGSPVGEGEV